MLTNCFSQINLTWKKRKEEEAIFQTILKRKSQIVDAQY